MADFNELLRQDIQTIHKRIDTLVLTVPTKDDLRDVIHDAVQPLIKSLDEHREETRAIHAELSNRVTITERAAIRNNVFISTLQTDLAEHDDKIEAVEKDVLSLHKDKWKLAALLSALGMGGVTGAWWEKLKGLL